MKKQFLLLGAILFGVSAFAQQAPTNTAPGGVGPSGQNNQQFWSRAGNSNAIGTNNIFGTLWNSPIYTVTAGVTRTRLNGNLTQLINGVNQPVNGYFGIGPNGWFNSNSPWAMLHLEGPNSTVFPGNGWRSWMRTGLLMREESDQMYVGMKREATNQVDAVISWSDDATASGDGPDKLRFLFTGNASSGNGDNTNPLMGTSFNGYEFMRMQAVSIFNENNYRIGYVGIGPLFGSIAPQNRLHINAESGLPTFLQISNVSGGGTPGTGQLGTDGLKIGTQNVIFPAGNRQAGFLQWQENTPFIIQSEWDATAGSLGERLRITNRGALTNTEGFAFPASVVSDNITRVSISYLGSAPVNQPRSLLHIGFNGPNSWRQWMDLGTYAASGSTHTYLGVFDGTNNGTLAWGAESGNSEMRYIFTNNGSGEGATIDGLEAMRMTPTATLGVYTGIGGDPQTNLYGPAGTSQAPTQTLEVNSWGATNVLGGSSGLRFTNLNTTSPTIANPGQGVLSVDADGDVVYVAGGSSTGFSGACTDAVNGVLPFDSKTNLNNYNFYFENPTIPNLNTNSVGLGYNCSTVLPAKLSTFQQHITTVPQSTTAVSGIDNDIANAVFLSFKGVYGQANNTQNINLRPNMFGGDFLAGDGNLNHGVRGLATSPNQIKESNFGVWGEASDNNSATNQGGKFQAGLGSNNAGVVATADGNMNPDPNGLSYGVNAQAQFNLRQNAGVVGRTFPNFINNYYGAQQNIGVGGLAGGANLNIGIYGEAATTTNTANYAGYFVGSTVFGGALIIASDSTLKENIQPLPNNFDSLLMQLHPYQYEFKTTGDATRLGAKPGIHYGVLAQEVASLFPQVVVEVTHPAELDSVGNIVNPSFNYKAIDFVQLLPLMLFDAQKKTESIQNLQNQVTSLIDSVSNQSDSLALLTNLVNSQQATIIDLNDRLTQLENCLSGILPLLCQLSQQAIESNTPSQQEVVRNTLAVTLNNKNAIILDQNVPNPFAEQTVINFSIPATVQKAQIHFYDGNGKLMQSVDVTERGLGSLTVFGSDLSSGVYTYTLVADGQIVATKKMMKQ